MTFTDSVPRRRWRQFRRLAVAFGVVLFLLAFGGWLRGQDQWGPFRGQVVDEETGAPIANANVVVAWRIYRFGFFVETVSEFFDARETVTDREGRFALPRVWRLWTLDVTPPGITVFAPGYVMIAVEVTPPDGARYVDPTIFKMRPLKTRKERCLETPHSPLHDRAPRFRDAIYRYRSSLDCHLGWSDQ